MNSNYFSFRPMKEELISYDCNRCMAKVLCTCFRVFLYSWIVPTHIWKEWRLWIKPGVFEVQMKLGWSLTFCDVCIFLSSQYPLILQCSKLHLNFSLSLSLLTTLYAVKVRHILSPATIYACAVTNRHAWKHIRLEMFRVQWVSDIKGSTILACPSFTCYCIQRQYQRGFKKKGI